MKEMNDVCYVFWGSPDKYRGQLSLPGWSQSIIPYVYQMILVFKNESV